MRFTVLEAGIAQSVQQLRYGLDTRRIVKRLPVEIRHSFRPSSKPLDQSCLGRISPGDNAAEALSRTFTPPSVEIENERSHTSFHAYAFRDCTLQYAHRCGRKHNFITFY
jgi:hypothetical protein